MERSTERARQGGNGGGKMRSRKGMGGYRGGCPEARRSMKERSQEAKVKAMHMVMKESRVTDGTVSYWKENVLLNKNTQQDVPRK